MSAAVTARSQLFPPSSSSLPTSSSSSLPSSNGAAVAPPLEPLGSGRSSSPSPSPSPAPSSAPLIGSVVRKRAVVDLEPRCPECGSTDVLDDQRGGVLVCTACGLQLGGQQISEESEWRDFDDDGPRSHGAQSNRVGGPEDGLFFMGLSTVMGASADGNNALARLQSRSTTLLNTKALLDAFHRLSRIAAPLSLPQGVVERSCELYSKAMEAGLFKSQKGDSALFACIQLACKQENVPRTMKEIMPPAPRGEEERQRELTRAVKKAFKKMKAHRIGLAKAASAAPSSASGDADAGHSSSGSGGPSSGGSLLSGSGFASSAGATASSLVERFCSTLRLPLQLEKAVRAVIDEAERRGVLDGKTPATIAGAAIFLVTQLADPAGAVRSTGAPISYTRTWEQVALVTLTAASTLKKAYRSLYAERANIVPTTLASPMKISQLQPG